MVNKIKYLVTYLLILLSICSSAQLNNALVIKSKKSTILADSSNIYTDSLSLLPDKYLLTQKLFWGKNGLMRNFDSYKLSKPEREHELEIRNTMISVHQYLGYATLILMSLECINGIRLENGENSLGNIHSGLGATVNICYFTSAGMAFFAPPPMYDREEGYNSLKLHKIVSVVGFSSMIATNILGPMLKNNPSLEPYHCATAFVSYGSLLTSTIIIKF
jgi:hypothetical protein